ncbi:MAG TPA: tetratricopeptide repeat protein, partial [Candidatus Sulfopaludibacter sp.]|nr:tetratricopeptide repeat protein [Candidatus Sulfopaludibacter sp.]
KDQRYGPAHYRLALTYLKLGQVAPAVHELHVSIELLKKDGAEGADHYDSVVKLSEIYLAVARDKQFLDEVDGYCKELLARDPNSFDGHRLTADLNFVRAGQAFQTARKDEGQELLDAALAEYRKADSITPGNQGVMMQLARTLTYKGDYDSAAKLYQQVIDKDKTYEGAYTELYRLYLFQNKADDGERILKLAFQNNPKKYVFLRALALHYSALHRRDDMINVLQQIKSHAKDFDQAYFLVGDFYLLLGDGDSAVREYREGMTKDPKRKTTYQKRIIEALMRQGKRNEAAQLNAEILKEHPDDTDAKGLEGSLLLDKGDVNRALQELQGVVTRAPDNPVARFNLGRAHAALGQYEQARQMFQKAIELRPDYVLARLALAQLEVTRGDFDAALKTAQAVLNIDRGNVNARLIESAALMGQKKFSDSRQLLAEMLKVNPSSPDVLFQLGIVSLAENKYKEAEDDFRRSYELNPANPRGLMGMVETQMAQNKTDEALKLLAAEAAKNPNRLDLQVQLGNTAVRAGKYDQAIGYFQKVLDSLDKNARQRGDLYLRIGETYRRKGDLGNAIIALQKAREVEPNNVVVLSTLALVLDGSNRWSEASQVYDATIKLDPNNGVALNNKAFLMAEHGGDLDMALTMAQQAKRMLPNLSEVSDTLGWIYLKKGLSDNAIDIFKDLVAKEPHASTYRFHLGMAYFQKGDKPTALKQLQDALKDNPAKLESDKIKELIAKIG